MNIQNVYEQPSIRQISLKEITSNSLKRDFKKKEQFPTEQSEEKYLVMQFNKYNERHMNHVHRGFGQTIRDDWFKN